MMNLEAIKAQIAALLRGRAEMVILFGSRAEGTAGRQSDIDLYVVADSDEMPKTWRQKSDIHLRVAEALKPLMRDYPVDLIVHTRPMYRKFLQMQSAFGRKILQEGERIL